MISSIGKSMQTLGGKIQASEIDTLDGNITFATNNHIVLATSGTGTKIGTATAQKLGFYNATPVNQPDTVADATDATDVIARVNDIIDRLQELGLIA